MAYAVPVIRCTLCGVRGLVCLFVCGGGAEQPTQVAIDMGPSALLRVIRSANGGGGEEEDCTPVVSQHSGEQGVGVDVLVSTLRAQPLDQNTFRHMGIQLERNARYSSSKSSFSTTEGDRGYDIVALKSTGKPAAGPQNPGLLTELRCAWNVSSNDNHA